MIAFIKLHRQRTALIWEMTVIKIAGITTSVAVIRMDSIYEERSGSSPSNNQIIGLTKFYHFDSFVSPRVTNKF